MLSINLKVYRHGNSHGNLRSGFANITPEVFLNTNDSLATLYTDGTSKFTKQVILAAVSLACLMTIGGNISIILCVTRWRNLSKTNYSVYILSLAWADLCVGLFVQPAMSVYTFFGYWPFGSIPCAIYIVFDYCLCCISYLHLNAIAFDRLRSVADPLKYRSNFTKRRARNICIVLWIGNILFWGVPIIITRIFKEIQGAVLRNECYYKPNKYYTLFVSISFVYGLIIYLIITSAKLVLALRAAEGNISKADSKTQTTSNISTGATTDFNKATAQNKRVIRTLAVLIVVFAICVGPWSALWVVISFCSTCVSDTAYEIAYWLSYVNSLVNPYMYFIFNADFRAAFHYVFCREHL